MIRTPNVCEVLLVCVNTDSFEHQKQMTVIRTNLTDDEQTCRHKSTTRHDEIIYARERGSKMYLECGKSNQQLK
jgi:hypothetical protein